MLATRDHARVIPPHLWIIKDKLGDKRYEQGCNHIDIKT